MITENDIFNLQKAILYSFRNIPEYSEVFLNNLHDELFQIGGIKVLNYNDKNMSIALDIITNRPSSEIMQLIMKTYSESVKQCIASNYFRDGNMILQNILPEVVDMIIPICITILDMTTNKDSKIFRINLHN